MRTVAASRISLPHSGPNMRLQHNPKPRRVAGPEFRIPSLTREKPPKLMEESITLTVLVLRCSKLLNTRTATRRLLRHSGDEPGGNVTGWADRSEERRVGKER